MMGKNITQYAFVDALLTALYIILIGCFFYLANHGLFGVDNSVFIPIFMLMLFVFSAALTGSLVFGRPIIWYLDGKKRDALALLAYTLLILFVITIIVFLALLLFLR